MKVLKNNMQGKEITNTVDHKSVRSRHVQHEMHVGKS